MMENAHIAFVTGGSGFVGLHFLKFLLKQYPNMQIRALARSKAATQKIQGVGAKPVSSELDDEELLYIGMTGCDVVFHIAAKTDTWGKYEDFYQTNVSGTECLLAAARKAKVSRFIYISTEAVLLGGEPIVDVDESRLPPAHPLGFYAQTKALAEERVLQANSPEFTTVILRPRFVWGPGMTILQQLSQMVRSGSFVWINQGKYLTSICHVINLCEGMLLAAERGRGGEIYFLTDEAPVEFRSFITALLHTQNLTPGKRSIPGWTVYAAAWVSEWLWRTFHLKGTPPLTRALVLLSSETVTVNDTKARHELGYTSTVSYEEGLAMLTL